MIDLLRRLFTDAKPDVARRRGGLLLALCVAGGALASCATAPYFDERVVEQNAATSTPEIVDAGGPLTADQSREILARVVSEPGEPGMLRRHLAIEEAVAGRPLVAGNRVSVLKDGPPTLKAMFAAIRGARRHVNLEYYLLEDVESDGVKLGDLLLEKRRQGVAVTMIYDSIGSSGTPAAFFERLRKAGVKVVEFSPVQPINTINALMFKELWPFETSARNKSFNDRDHRKLLIVDGAKAIVGGVNLSGTYQGGSAARSGAGGTPTEHWRDTDLIIEGPVVGELQQIFLEQWRKQDGPPLDPESLALFPRLSRKGAEVVRVIASTPDQPIPGYYTTLLSAIRNAERRIWLSAAYFVPTRQQMEFLTEAAQRGVDVRLLLPDKSDSQLAIAMAHSHYSRLLEAGVRVFETHGLVLHTKTVVIDGVWSAVGSSNFDQRSVLFNDELDAIVLGNETARELERMFEDDTKAATEITREAWDDRPIDVRLKEFLALAAERWL